VLIIERTWIEPGKTTLFGQYLDHDGGSNTRRGVEFDGVDEGRILSTGVEMFGIGVVQGIDAAASSSLGVETQLLQGTLSKVSVDAAVFYK
jgi:hypothetical protein